ncbi:MAG: PucR family transcriptional regulator [Sporichthyaceae bacterium]
MPSGPSRELAGALGGVRAPARDLARSMDRDKSAAIICNGLMDIVFPDRKGDDAFREMLLRNAYDDIDTVWRIIAGQDELEAAPPFGTLAFSDMAAELGVPLSQFERIYRVGVGLAWSDWCEAAVEYSRTHDVDLVDLIGGPSMIIHAYSDGQMTQLVERYESTQAQDRRTREQLQLSVLRQVLDGAAVLTEAEVEGALGIRLAGEHVAIAVRSDRSPLEIGLAQALLRDADGAKVLEYRHGVRLWLLWISHPRGLGARRLRAVREALRRSGLRCALGEAATGHAGLGVTGRDALDAARLQDMLGEEASLVVSFDELSLEALLLADPERARRFVHDELGELDRDDNRTAALRDTARVWLTSGSNVGAATLLGVHEHTVRNRIAQIESVVGRPLSERRTELLVALRLRRLLDAAPPTS